MHDPLDGEWGGGKSGMGLSDTSACCLLDFMSFSVALEVMPHSATSRASGDDTSTIKCWNSGV